MSGASGRRWFVVLAGAVALLLVAAIVAPAIRRPRSAPPVEPAAPQVPDPTTTAMQQPVVERIAEARGEVLKRPESPGAWGRLGMVLDAHHLYRDAATCYRRAHDLDPAEFRWPYFLAIVEDHEGASADDTTRLLDIAAAIRPDYPPLHARLGEILARSGRIEAARRAYEKALELAPGYPIAHRGMGQVLLALDDASGALQSLESAASIQDGDRATYAAMAQACVRLGMPQRASDAAEKARRFRSLYSFVDQERSAVGPLGASSTVAIDRARFRLSTGQYAAAVEDLKLAERATPDDEWIHRQLSIAYGRLGEKELAEIHRVKAERLKEGE